MKLATLVMIAASVASCGMPTATPLSCGFKNAGAVALSGSTTPQAPMLVPIEVLTPSRVDLDGTMERNRFEGQVKYQYPGGDVVSTEPFIGAVARPTSSTEPYLIIGRVPREGWTLQVETKGDFPDAENSRAVVKGDVHGLETVSILTGSCGLAIQE